METPCFVINVEDLDNAIQNMFVNLKKIWHNGIAGYSIKTNNFPWLITHMKEKGLFAEAVSSDEYNLAKALGYRANQIIFNGPVKSSFWTLLKMAQL